MVKYNFRHNRKNEAATKGSATIFLELSLSRKRKFISTKIKIGPVDWNEKKQEVKRSHPDHEKLNLILRTLLKKYQDFEFEKLKEYASQTRIFQLEDFTLLKTKEDNSSPCFIIFIDNYIKRCEKLNTRAENTITGYRTVKKYLEEYQKTIPFFTVNTDFGREINKFFDSKYPNWSKGYRHNIEKNIKAFLSQAEVQNHISKDIEIQVKRMFTTPKPKKKSEVWLSMADVKKIEKYIPTTPALEIARDVFLMCCYTGLRISDVLQLTSQNVKFAKDKTMLLEVKIQKGSTNHDKPPLTIPIGELFKEHSDELSSPERLINKYIEANETGTLNNDSQEFFILSDQKVNLRLKDISKSLKLNIGNKLTSKIGRETFAKLLQSEFDMHITTVNQFLGHSDLKTTMIYSTAGTDELTELLRAKNKKRYSNE